MKAHVHTKSCTWMFVESVFLISQIWKQHECQGQHWHSVSTTQKSTGQWIHEVWYTIKSYSAIK